MRGSLGAKKPWYGRISRTLFSIPLAEGKNNEQRSPQVYEKVSLSPDQAPACGRAVGGGFWVGGSMKNLVDGSAWAEMECIPD